MIHFLLLNSIEVDKHNIKKENKTKGTHFLMASPNFNHGILRIPEQTKKLNPDWDVVSQVAAASCGVSKGSLKRCNSMPSYEWEKVIQNNLERKKSSTSKDKSTNSAQQRWIRDQLGMKKASTAPSTAPYSFLTKPLDNNERAEVHTSQVCRPKTESPVRSNINFCKQTTRKQTCSLRFPSELLWYKPEKYSGAPLPPKPYVDHNINCVPFEKQLTRIYPIIPSEPEQSKSSLSPRSRSANELTKRSKYPTTPLSNMTENRPSAAFKNSAIYVSPLLGLSSSLLVSKFPKTPGPGAYNPYHTQSYYRRARTADGITTTNTNTNATGESTHSPAVARLVYMSAASYQN